MSSNSPNNTVQDLVVTDVPEVRLCVEDYIEEYNFITKVIENSGTNSNWYNFMNHGYYPPYSFLDKSLVLKNSASLYLNILENIDTDNKKLLDVGCGRGGGVQTYNKYLNLKSIDACDINPVSINYCKQNQPNINFKLCNAEVLDYQDSTFDIVTNVESSYYYTDINKFFKEVRRVLSPTGTFCYTDILVNSEIHRNNILPQSNLFSEVETRDITENVLEACHDLLKNSLHNFDEPLRKWLLKTIHRKAFYYEKKRISFKIHICHV